jgi:hypothetical protein
MGTPEIIERPQQESALMRLDPQALISKAIETGAGIDTMERLVALAKEVRAMQAKEAWYAAMAQFQATCPAIFKTKTARIHTARASYAYAYSPLDEILSVIHPVMGQLGLSVGWKTRIELTAAVANCRISHELGHTEESGEFVIPIEKSEDGRGATPAQRVGIAMTYAKRYSLLGAIGMAPEDDEDGEPGDAGEAGGGEQPQRGEPHQAADPGALITNPQVKRFYAIARGTKPFAWTDEQLHDLLASYKLGSATEIQMSAYDAIVEKLKAGPPKPNQSAQGSLA